MSLWTSLEPSSATVDPGASTRVRLRLRNTGDVVDEYRFEPVGPIAPWTTVEPATLRLYPGTTGSVELTFAPPRTPDATAGPNPYAVRITPTEHPEAVTVPEGNLTITPFTELRAELVPPTVKGRFRGRPKLAIDNLGNTKLTASVSGSDNGDQLVYDLHPSNVQIDPGRAAFVKATLRPRRIIWFGPKEQRPYRLTVQRSGVNPQPVDGTYLQRGFLPRWLATLFGTLLALAVTFALIWFNYKPHVQSLAQEQPVEAAVSSIAPSPSVTPTPPPAPTETPSSAPPANTANGNGGGSGGGGGGGATATVTAKPKQDTAATAVNRLAADDPAGRHICYRSYVQGTGWQKPVCDGTMSGTVGKNLPIKAINLAVYGVQGSAANWFHYDARSTSGQGTWYPNWTAIIADGKDNYIGSTKAADPYIEGFAFNVGNGQSCSSAKVRDHDWGDQWCKGPRSDNNALDFVGTLDNTLWLEAFKLTVTP
ncbi:hydrolase [Streptomyces sp. Ag109_O5-10]|uniref:hydrolase n=1 Tax=Streptomyces sp. Ag109_O5-10 TaxID=1855349 RepID=UPI000899020D|nr:hydrolase [Streptomyces sp. Ag109_O5-10]SEE88581.1 hydrophobic W protein [Streptomyces sp. Ag109_O5-10]